MIKRNYQRELSALLDALPENNNTPPTLLLHSCCGPCSSYVLEYLSAFFAVTVLFYNPNIQPEDEYIRRLHTQQELITKLQTKHPISTLSVPWQGAVYTQKVQGMEDTPEGGIRCTTCISMRLRETAQIAKHHGFPYFCTTLTVSPHKNALLINTLGEALAQRYGIIWLPSDFKKRGGYQRSIALSREYGLYRQNYCGCLFSKPTDPWDGTGETRETTPGQDGKDGRAATDTTAP